MSWIIAGDGWRAKFSNMAHCRTGLLLCDAGGELAVESTRAASSVHLLDRSQLGPRRYPGYDHRIWVFGN